MYGTEVGSSAGDQAKVAVREMYDRMFVYCKA